MDAIDKRNFKEKIAKSIIKRQNVHFISQEELDRAKQEDALKILKEEAEKKEAEKRAMIENALKEQERKKYYNESTNAYSGEYGKDQVVDEVTRGQIEKILEEKEIEFRKSLENTIEQQL